MNKYKDIVNLISSRLETISDYSDCSYSNLLEAQKYSLTAGGKHLRGLILIKCAQLGGISPEKVIDYACAVEMVHTYSLIHDDLPEMDNDDLRRGKATCHKVFGDAIALLAGDALLSKAFNVIAVNNNFDSDIKLECIRILSESCGEHGMLAGQAIDKNSEDTLVSPKMLDELHARKTGDMFACAVIMGCTLGNVPEKTKKSLVKYMELLGLAFQIKDDILDVVSSADVLGKPTDSDEKSEKSTYVSIYGLEKAKTMLDEKISSAKLVAEEFSDSFFVELADYFANRIK